MQKNEIIKELERVQNRMKDRYHEAVVVKDVAVIIDALLYMVSAPEKTDIDMQMAEAENPSTKPKKGRKKRENTVDYGKIVALSRAPGWNQKKIAEEMGVSETAISMALKRYKKKMEDGFVWNPEEREFIKKV